MSNAIVTFKLMPKSPDTDVESIKVAAEKIAKEAGAKGDTQTKIEPLAFGLKQVLVMGMYEMNDNADFDSICDKMKAEIDGVTQAEVANMDLALG
ncbi:hypothetical protein K9M74_01395 [Candidatus Woesearchaeota archaeon]|nr:hypothetical protein [Candidatus Woesearchaeota archaeon]